MVRGRFVRLFACLLALFSAPAAHAYKGAIHFYATYTIGALCGLDRERDSAGLSEALAIAWASQNVDRFPDTDAGAEPWDWFRPSKVRDRRIFHFPVEEGGRVTPASAAALFPFQAAIEEAESGRPDPLFLGIAIHVLQDSWAHEGYEPTFGHMWTTAPDYAHDHPEAADEMLIATWHALNSWKERVHGSSCEGSAEGALALISIWNRYEARGKGDLTRYWQSATEAFAGRPIPYTSAAYQNKWESAFVDASMRTRLLFGQGRVPHFHPHLDFGAE